MRSQLICCFLSACFGVAVTILCLARPAPQFTTPAVAQDRAATRSIDDRSAPGWTTKPLGSGIALSDLSVEEQINVAVYEKVNRGVVNITTRSWSPEMFLMREPPSEGAGSGSVLDKRGHILTNDHVIAGASQIRVTLYNGESFLAQVVGTDASNDSAVLRIEAPPEMLFPIPLGDSSGLLVGQKMYAIGNPFGLERTMTVGILSNVSRTLTSRTGRKMKSILQVDAALNQGNSGGPLLSSRGDLVGMNTAIASPSGAGENTGIGFAIPVNTLHRVVPQLIEHGRVIRPTIGIAQVLETEEGLLIVNVTDRGPADRAGLRGFRIVREIRGGFPVAYLDRSRADLLVAIDGQPVRSAEGLLSLIESKKPGDRVQATILRDGVKRVVGIVLDEDE